MKRKIDKQVPLTSLMIFNNIIVLKASNAIHLLQYVWIGNALLALVFLGLSISKSII